MTQQSGWHDNPQDRSRLRYRDAVMWSSDVTPAGPKAAGRPVAGIRRRP